MTTSDNGRNEKQLAKPDNLSEPLRRRPRRSVWDQSVAPLFTASIPERRVRALPVLRELRALIASTDCHLLDGLRAVETEDNLAVEFARWALRYALLPGMDFTALHRWADKGLCLWLIDRALTDCGSARAPHRGGWRISGGRP